MKKIINIIILLCFFIQVKAQSDTSVNVYICKIVNRTEASIPFWGSEPNILRFIQKFGHPYKIERTTSEMYLERGFYYLNKLSESTEVFIQYLEDSLMDGQPNPTYFENFTIESPYSVFYIRLNDVVVRVGNDIRTLFQLFPNGHKTIYDDSDDCIYTVFAKHDIEIGYSKSTHRITDIRANDIRR